MEEIRTVPERILNVADLQVLACQKYRLAVYSRKKIFS
jgi:hypothetical protein